MTKHDPQRLDPIVVLGCRVRLERGALVGELGRRVAAASRVDRARAGASLVVVSGGRSWGGVVEADAMADELESLGVARSRIVRDRLSMSTSENARYAGALLRELGHDSLTIVTSPAHGARAQWHFEALGFSASVAVAPHAERGARRALWGTLRERAALELARRGRRRSQ